MRTLILNHIQLGHLLSIERQGIRDPRVEAVSFMSDGFIGIGHGGLWVRENVDLDKTCLRYSMIFGD